MVEDYVKCVVEKMYEIFMKSDVWLSVVKLKLNLFFRNKWKGLKNLVKIEVNFCYWYKVREKVFELVTSGCGFIFDWLRKW